MEASHPGAAGRAGAIWRSSPPDCSQLLLPLQSHQSYIWRGDSCPTGSAQWPRYQSILMAFQPSLSCHALTPSSFYGCVPRLVSTSSHTLHCFLQLCSHISSSFRQCRHLQGPHHTGKQPEEAGSRLACAGARLQLLPPPPLLKRRTQMSLTITLRERWAASLPLHIPHVLA